MKTTSWGKELVKKEKKVFVVTKKYAMEKIGENHFVIFNFVIVVVICILHIYVILGFL